jgi:hypothetical protein
MTVKCRQNTQMFNPTILYNMAQNTTILEVRKTNGYITSVKLSGLDANFYVDDLYLIRSDINYTKKVKAVRRDNTMTVTQIVKYYFTQEQLTKYVQKIHLPMAELCAEDGHEGDLNYMSRY